MGSRTESLGELEIGYDGPKPQIARLHHLHSRYRHDQKHRGSRDNQLTVQF